jgi:hypothetical protein
MKRSVSIVLASIALASLALGGIASCNPGVGERCQVQEDCEAGLQCTVGEGVCRAFASGDIDAPPPPDAPPDAPADAPPDAP